MGQSKSEFFEKLQNAVCARKGKRILSGYSVCQAKLMIPTWNPTCFRPVQTRHRALHLEATREGRPEGYRNGKALREVPWLQERGWGNSLRAGETSSPEDTSYTNLSRAFTRILISLLQVKLSGKWYANEGMSLHQGTVQWKKLEPGKVKIVESI